MLNLSGVTRQIRPNYLLLNISIGTFPPFAYDEVFWGFFSGLVYAYLLTFSTFFMSLSLSPTLEEEKVAHPRHRTIIEMGPRWPSIGLTT